MPPVVMSGFTRDLHRIRGKNRSRKEQRPMVFAAVQTVADPDTFRCAEGLDPDSPAQTAPFDLIHLSHRLLRPHRRPDPGNVIGGHQVKMRPAPVLGDGDFRLGPAAVGRWIIIKIGNDIRVADRA